MPKSVCALAITLAAAMLTSNDLRAEELGVKVADGFTVQLYADDDQAHDIHCLTFDSLGRPVVSGIGYVKILEDQNGDGRADQVKEFVDGPKTGAQGMTFHGRDLLCIGDGGLIRYRDRNADDRADGAADMFVRAKTGNEHDVHAIRRGPDGYWYVISGNMAEISDRYITLPNSPVPKPRSGTLMRFTPDLKAAEVVSHGYRNAYDFDFSASGDLFTFDSDGEPEMTLPWYRPTRVFHLTLGSDCGWFTKTCLHPNHFLDMPPVVGDFGRSSPTGVVCYRHTQFPAPYRGALFVLDWTYGRIWALPLTPNGSTWAAKPIEFMASVGEHGFAPTDADIGPDGALYVTVGGRGTRGSVYRVTYNGPAVPAPAAATAMTAIEKRREILSAPQPLSAWSRARWEPLLTGLNADVFREAILDASLSAEDRVRAIEILTEKFQGLDADTLARIPDDAPWPVLARAAWSQGRTAMGRPDPKFLARCMSNVEPQVQRNALEAMLSAEKPLFESLIPSVTQGLASTDRFVRQAAARILTRVSGETYGKIAQLTLPRGWQATIPLALGLAWRKEAYSPYAVDIATRVLGGDFSPAMKLEAARLLQIGLGDLVPNSEEGYEIFDGYESRVDLSPRQQELEALRETLAEVFPTGIAQVDEELSRALAMVQPASPALLTKVLAQISPVTSPTLDLHYLHVAARLPAERNAPQRELVAAALLSIETKVEARKLIQDAAWDDRILELYEALVERDPGLPVAVLEHPLFGRPGHVQYVSALPEEKFPLAVEAFAKQVEKNPEYRLNSDIVFLLAAGGTPRTLNMLRERFDNLSLRPAILTALSELQNEQDRDLFLTGMESAPVDILAECAKALALMKPGSPESARENVTLVRVIRRLGTEGQDREVRDQVAELLGRNLGTNFGYQNGRDGDTQGEPIARWTELVQQKYPDEMARQTGGSAQDLDQLKTILASVAWDKGRADLGEKLFTTRACIQCHGARKALGPDLHGAANRFSKLDLFIAIAMPSRDVSPRYQTTMIETKDGKIFSGMIVYENIDALVLRNSSNQSFRIETKEIEQRRTMSTSLMPNGLIQGLRPEDLADLYAYLRSLGTANVQATAPATEGSTLAK